MNSLGCIRIFEIYRYSTNKRDFNLVRGTTSGIVCVLVVNHAIYANELPTYIFETTT